MLKKGGKEQIHFFSNLIQAKEPGNLSWYFEFISPPPKKKL